MYSFPFRPASGQTSAGDSLGHFCGSSGPSVTSTGRYLYLKYNVNGRESGTGFNITYRKLQCIHEASFTIRGQLN